MKGNNNKSIDFGGDKILSIILRLAPPVMIAQLIQALYNIIDSYFIGRYSEDGLTALSIVYPIQLLMIALAVGTGVGINTVMAHYRGIHKDNKSDEAAGVGPLLAFVMWIIFALVTYLIMPYYARISSNSEQVVQEVITYGRIVSVFSIGVFFESIWTKVLQAVGNMKIPMIAQVVGAIVNIILDPILIFGIGIIPRLGIAGAAIATVLGQIVAAFIVMRKGYRKSPAISKYMGYIKRIYYLGFPNMLMQSAYTFYILGLNLILKGFSDQAVTALGLYYKWQTFFFIPLGAMQTCIVPILSYNYSAGNNERCKSTLKDSVLLGFALMFIGVLCFELIPSKLLGVFSQDTSVISIGITAFRIIGISFIPMVTSLIFPVFFQAIGYSIKSSILTILRTVVLFVPLGWLFSRVGLQYFWITFPLTETITTIVGFALYRKFNSIEEEIIST
ncbi:MATE family efflux transporter [Clostridium sp. MSJ-8]|uniref:MATE family efflux transporter n=1 Tax=Clostridium sp. MSJ-8 TaxID=2841510 RepID=UPI001C0EF6FE|nr:MATE family efflux transporter [Clostridium sp. MSJ-8]MBU5488303.1 MATE family efflux transporter [Clostridium sp. MSJ-8]